MQIISFTQDKFAFWFTLLMLVTLPASAQSNATYKITVTTNSVTAPPQYRQVNGQIYDITRSVLWANVSGQCIEVKTNGTFVQTFQTNTLFESYYVPAPANVSVGAYTPAGSYGWKKRAVSTEVTPDKIIFIRNYFGVVRQPVTIAAMQVGSFLMADRVVELWDCGRTVITTSVRTNRIAIKP